MLQIVQRYSKCLWIEKPYLLKGADTHAFRIDAQFGEFFPGGSTETSCARASMGNGLRGEWYGVHVVAGRETNVRLHQGTHRRFEAFFHWKLRLGNYCRAIFPATIRQTRAF